MILQNRKKEGRLNEREGRRGGGDHRDLVRMELGSHRPQEGWDGRDTPDESTGLSGPGTASEMSRKEGN